MTEEKQIILEIGSENFPLESCQYSIHRDMDHTGKPAGVTHSGQISISLHSTNNTFFAEWISDEAERKDGQVTFPKHDSEGILKTLKFTNAFVVNYSENCLEGSRSSEDVVISAQKLTIVGSDEVEIDNRWPQGT